MSHTSGEIARPIAELMVQADVFGAGWKGKKSAVPHAPFLENRHGQFEQPLRHAAVPVFRQDRQGPEESERSPTRNYIRSDQTAGIASRDHFDVRRAPARLNAAAGAHELER